MLQITFPVHFMYNNQDRNISVMTLEYDFYSHNIYKRQKTFIQNTRICSYLLLQTNDFFFLMTSSFSAIIFQAILRVCDQSRLSDNATGLHYGKLYEVLHVFNLLFFIFFSKPHYFLLHQIIFLIFSIFLFYRLIAEETHSLISTIT